MLQLENSLRTQINDTVVAYQETGQGDPVVLVHGGVSDLRTWSHQFQTLGKKHRTIVYSRRYALPNDPIGNEADDPIQTHVADLASLVSALDATPSHIVGHSWGGLVALLLAMQRPQLVRSLVLIEPPALTLFVDMPPKPTQLLSLLFRKPGAVAAIVKLGATAMGPAEKAFRRGDDDAAIRAFGHGVLGKHRFHTLSKERYAQVWDNRGPDRAQMLGSGFPSLSTEDVAHIDLPVLLICGNESPAVFRHLSQYLLELLPDARLQMIEGASHMVQEDEPEEFNQAVLSFFEGK